jgi:hypothetical protein
MRAIAPLGVTLQCRCIYRGQGPLLQAALAAKSITPPRPKNQKPGLARGFFVPPSAHLMSALGTYPEPYDTSGL